MAEFRAGRDSLLSGGSALVGLVAGFGTVVLVAHERGAAAAGVLFGAIGLFTILATVSKLGTETTFVYYVGQMRGGPGVERAALRGLVRLGLRPVASVSTVIAGLLFVSAGPLSEFLIDAEFTSDYASVMRVLAAFVPVWALTLPLLGVTRGLGDLVPTAIGLLIVQPALQLVLVAAALYSGGSPGVIAAAWAAPLVLTLVSAADRVRRAINSAPSAGEAGQVPGAREFWSHATPRGFAGTLSMAVDRLGVVLVAGLGSAEAAGAWTAITRLLGICLRVVHAMSQALNAKLPALLAAGRTGTAMGQAQLATWWTIALLTPVLSVTALFPNPALALFGMQDINGAVAALQLASAAAAVHVVLAHVDNVLLMSGRSSLVLLDGLPSLAALIGLSVMLLPSQGLVGAAIAWVVSAAIYRVLAMAQVHRMYATWILTPRIAFDSITLATACVLVCLALRTIGGENLITACAAGVVSSFVSIAIMWFVKRRPTVTSIEKVVSPTAARDVYWVRAYQR